MQRLDRRDWLFLSTCLLVFAVSLTIALTNFRRAFPEASIEFRYDRDSSRAIALRLLADQHVDVSAMRNTAIFDADDNAKTFLERTLGLDRAEVVMRRDVRLWFWHQRWFRPLQEEELSVDVAPTGEIVSFGHRIPEDRAVPDPGGAGARQLAAAFLRRAGIDVSRLPLVDSSERMLPHRIQRIFTWESTTVRPAGAPYRDRVTVDGNLVTQYEQRLRVPDDWQRSYRDLRSKNVLAGNVDSVFLVMTIVAALIVFVTRLRRRDIHLRFLLAIAIASIVLAGGVALNSFPSVIAGYDTTSSYPAFLARFILLGVLLQGVGTAMFLIVICGAGEVLYRERLPQHLAIPRIWTRRALASKRVFRSFVLGYTLVAFFLAYQVVFYLVASHFGAWAPAEIPYDDILNTAFPWMAVLFAGFFPALSEEFMSRAFSLPLFERILRSRVAAIIVAGFIWGFGHATYPNQPFYIRGVEVGCAGVVIGILFYRFGLLPLLIWHITVDAFYTALLLFRSHNGYYVVSAAASSFVFAIPMLISIVLYLRNGGFVPDDDLSNAMLPVTEPPLPPAAERLSDLPPAIPIGRRQIVTCVVVVALASLLAAVRPASPTDAIDYRINEGTAKSIAASHLARVVAHPSYERIIATPLDGFRSWDRDSKREDGGGPGGFDSTAAEHMLASGLTMEQLIDVFRSRIEAGTWMVRFFTPMKKEEYFVEIDPRTSRPTGFHRYLDERAAGPRLDQAAALSLASRSFAAEGIDPAGFEVKEALAFQQPNRRDWLFHFQERKALVDEAFRRISVRVCGADVTQFTKTVKIPDAVYRAAAMDTFRNVILVVLRIIGTITIIALIVTGFVTTVLRHRPRWSSVLRWTLILSPLAVVSVANGYEASLFGYGTSIRWETFYAGLALEASRDVVLRLGALLLSLAVIDSAYPHALRSLSAEGRRRFGRAALIAAVTAIAVVGSVRGIMQLVAQPFPASANVAVDVPGVVAARVPSAIVVVDAIFDSIAAAGVVAAFAAGLGALPRRRHLAAAVTIGSIFGTAIDTAATTPQMPLMLFRAALLAVVIWLVADRILNGNLLAWPISVFLAAFANGIVAMLANHRPDLRVHAVIASVLLVAALAWIAIPSPLREEPAFPPPAES